MAVAKSEKVGIVERTKRYFRSMFQEMKRVHWPGRRDLIIYTIAVICVSLVVAMLIWLFDTGITALMGLILNLGR